MRRRGAIIVPGGVGSGLAAQGIPSMQGLIAGLAREHELTVYSLTAVKPEYQPAGFRLRSAYSTRPSRLATLAVMCRLVCDHLVHPYDVFHGFWARPAGLMAVLLGKLFRRTAIVSLQGGEAAAIAEIGYGDMLNPRRRARTLYACRQATHLVALTRFQAEAMVNQGLERDDLHVIPYGVDPGIFHFHRQPLKPPYRFLHVGNLTEVKGQASLLDLFALISKKVPATLTVVGADYLDQQLRSQANELGLQDQVEFTGFVPHVELPPYFHAAHFLLHTPLYEGQGVVVTEAAMTGTLVCGTQTGIMYDWQSEGLITVEVGKEHALADEIFKLIQAPHLYESKTDSAYAMAKRYDRNWTVDRYLEVYAR